MATKDDDYEDLNEDLEDEDRGDLFEDEEDESSESEEEDENTEDEGSDEDSDEDEEEEVVEKPAKDIKIPKSRLDEVIRQREEAKERSLWLEEQLEKLINQSVAAKVPTTPAKPEVPEYDFEAAEEQYISLIIEGEVSKATKLRSEINKARQAEFNSTIETIKEAALTNAKSEGFKAVQEQSFGTLIANMESKYKFLDHKSK